jgi:hypothetical protein
MKKTVLSSLFLLISVNICLAQLAELKLVTSGKYPDSYNEQRVINLVFQKYNTEFKFNEIASNQVKVSVDLSKVQKLEGISSKFIGPAKIKFSLTSINNPDTTTTWEYKVDVKETEQYKVFETLHQQFQDDPNGLLLFEKYVYGFLKNKPSVDCNSILEKAKLDIIKNKYKEAYLASISIKDSKCSVESKKLIEEINVAYSTEFCGDKLSRIKILANSGIEYKMELAIDEILKMPTQIKCHDEMVAISKQIGDYLAKKPGSERRQTEINNIIISGQSLDSIFRN